MLFVVRLEDKPERVDVRTNFTAAHKEWLAKNDKVILQAGSLRHDPDGTPVGGLWIVQAESKAEIEALLKNDPFWINGLRKGVEIYHWITAFNQRQVVL